MMHHLSSSFLLLVLLLLPHTTQAFQGIRCPAESEGPTNLPEGAECGGACFHLGTCAAGLVCAPPPPPPKEEGGSSSLFPSLPAKLSEFVKLGLGRAPTGICQKQEDVEAVQEAAAESEAIETETLSRERKVVRELGTSHDDLLEDGKLGGGGNNVGLHVNRKRREAGSRDAGASCPGCPTEVDVKDVGVIKAAQAALELLKAQGEFGTTEDEKEKVTLGQIVSATSQVVAGIRYRLVMAVVNVPTEAQRASSSQTRTTTKAGATLQFYEVDIVSHPWMDPPYTLIKATPIAPPPDVDVDAASTAAAGAAAATGAAGAAAASTAAGGVVGEKGN